MTIKTYTCHQCQCHPHWRGLLFILFCILGTDICHSQITWDTFVENYIIENEETPEQAELIYEQLNELRLNPIDLNTTTAEQLLQIPFISEEQATDIISYRDTHYPIHSTGELMFVSSLSHHDREILQIFCFAGEPKGDETVTLKNILQKSRNEALLRNDIPLYTTEGQKAGSDDKYRGNRMKQKLRYSFQSSNHLYVGVQTEKDAGERPLDYMAAYLLLKDIPTGRHSAVRELIVGNYRAGFGLGLAINTGINYSKNMQTIATGQSLNKGFTRHASFVESNYLSGAAIRYQYRRLALSAFGSYNKLDATYNADSTGIITIKTDGLHRTALEYSKRHNLGETNFGANLHVNIKDLQLSATAVLTHYSIPLTPNWTTPATLYRKYNASGRNFQAYSLSYSYHISSRLCFAGETALSQTDSHQTGVATINTITYKPNSNYTITLLYRNYGAKYTAIHGNAFSENSRPQNEQAIFMSWASSLSPLLTIYTHLDLIRFPWLKYGVSDTSYGIDYMAQATFSPGKVHRWMLRYQIKNKQKNYTANQSTQLQYNTRQTFKITHTLTPSPTINFNTTAGATIVNFADNPAETGYSITETVRWTTIPNLLRLNFALTYVDTDTYNARIYSYEPSLLYSFGINSFYYQAIRGLVMANLTPIQGLTITAKFVLTKYFDHDTIGTGTDQINSSLKSDLQLQLRYIF